MISNKIITLVGHIIRELGRGLQSKIEGVFGEIILDGDEQQIMTVRGCFATDSN